MSTKKWVEIRKINNNNNNNKGNFNKNTRWSVLDTAHLIMIAIVMILIIIIMIIIMVIIDNILSSIRTDVLEVI